MNIELLQFLAMESGCAYLSDLKFIRSFAWIQHSIRKIPEGTYSLHEWNDAVQYLTGTDSAFETEDQARRYLLNAERCGR